jgi:hypothetical protein
MNKLPYIKRSVELNQYVNVLEHRLKNIPVNSNVLETGNAWSTAGYDVDKNWEPTGIPIHQLDSFQQLRQLVNEVCCELYGEEASVDQTTSYITRSWTNKHLKGGQSIEHDHCGADIVFACYASVPENSGNFEMFYNGVWNEIEVKTNDVLIFPAHIKHRSQVSSSEYPRYVITLNLNRDFFLTKKAMRDAFSGQRGDMTDVISMLQNQFITAANSTQTTCLQIEQKLLSL